MYVYALAWIALIQDDSKRNQHFKKLWWTPMSSGGRNAYNFQKKKKIKGSCTFGAYQMFVLYLATE
jgi:hypothetical protein